MRMTDEEYDAYLKRRNQGLPQGEDLRGLYAQTDFADEAEFEAWVIERAEAAGWMVYAIRRTDLARVNWTGRDFPDLLAVRNGVLIGAELKMDGTVSMRVGQTRWLAELSCVPGVRAVLWQPADAENIIRQLEGAT